MNREKILQIVCNYYDIEDNIAKSNSRKQKIVTVRQVYCYLCFLFSKNTYDKIGELINRDHSTVIHSINTTYNLMSIEQDLYNSIQFLTEKIKTEPSIIVSDINLLQLSENYTNSFILVNEI